MWSYNAIICNRLLYKFCGKLGHLSKIRDALSFETVLKASNFGYLIYNKPSLACGLPAVLPGARQAIEFFVSQNGNCLYRCYRCGNNVTLYRPKGEPYHYAKFVDILMGDAVPQVLIAVIILTPEMSY